MTREIDSTRVICAVAEIPDNGSRGFTIGSGDWPLRGFLVRQGQDVFGYVNSCPHARHPLNFAAHRFLTPGGELILCSSHGALFDKRTGFCIAGPCSGQSLDTVPITIQDGFVMLAGESES